jgi:hypothetical protein
MKEDDLCLAFANKISASPEFTAWVLSHTKFGEFGSRVRVLHNEQASIRPRKFWWRHWWCTIPELAEQRETDIFVVFEIVDTKQQRFALHIENKKGNGRFAEGQAEAYLFRAQHMMNRAEYLSYSDFATILIAPLVFRHSNAAKCALFDCHLTYEDIAKFIPEFGNWASCG